MRGTALDTDVSAIPAHCTIRAAITRGSSNKSSYFTIKYWEVGSPLLLLLLLLVLLVEDSSVHICTRTNIRTYVNAVVVYLCLGDHSYYRKG